MGGGSGERRIFQKGDCSRCGDRIDVEFIFDFEIFVLCKWIDGDEMGVYEGVYKFIFVYVLFKVFTRYVKRDIKKIMI